ncbi:MAG: PucR family transcriptional regulator [Beutenbergiaceae bacterium]
MANRQEFAGNRTERPMSAFSSVTIRELLALPAVTAGRPQLLSGEQRLDTPVRWVHASDSPHVARLLDGGELLLSTGSGWPTEPAELRATVDALADAGLAGLVLELGTHYQYPPAVLVAAALARDLPLVCLHREVKFVTITEAVHRRVIAQQTDALKARDDVHARFTAMALRGSPADFIVRQLAQTLQAPVVLENLAHEVVVAQVPDSPAGEVLGQWQVRSRAAHRAARRDQNSVGSDWLLVPVEARGARWGHLIALPGPPHPAGRSGVLEQGAIALAVNRLTDNGDEWAELGRNQLLTALLGRAYVGRESMATRVEAAGMPVADAWLYGMVANAQTSVVRVDRAAQEFGGRALAHAGPQVGQTTVLLSLPRHRTFDDDLAREFAGRLGTAPTHLVLSIGSQATGVDAGISSVQEAMELSRAFVATDGPGPHIRRAALHPLAQLATALRDDRRVLEHGERMLAPLIDYDLAHRGDLLDVLGAMLAHPGNRTAAAAASHLSRSVFYQRLGLIGELLDVDLDDGQVQAALHLALLVRRSGQASP